MTTEDELLALANYISNYDAADYPELIAEVALENRLDETQKELLEAYVWEMHSGFGLSLEQKLKFV